MRRREFIALLGGMVAWPLPAHAQAQQPGKVYRIGVLADEWWPAIEGLHQGMRELGYVEGHNLRLEYRWVQGRTARYPALAEELVRLGVDAIVTQGTPAALGAQKATTTTPIVMAAVGDAGIGEDGGFRIVPSLAQPGGNTTGFTSLTSTLHVKRLELLKELQPNLSRVAVLLVMANPTTAVNMQRLRQGAESLGLTLAFVDVRDDDVEAALLAPSGPPPEAVLVTADPALLSRRARIVEVMADRRLPAMYPAREFAEAGGLMAYAPDYRELFRRAAGYVDKILNGVKPSALPVQQAEKFELVINLKTAAALGLTVPPSLLARADEVIE